MAKIIDLKTREDVTHGHNRCPKCGAVNGPFERLGSGVCNECLQRSVTAIKAANTRRVKREGKRTTGGR